MADYSSNPIQSGVSTKNNMMATNTKDYSRFSYFLSGVDVTSQNLGDFNPFVRGYARLFVYRMPYFMEHGFKTLSDRFKSYLETGYRSVNGINDLEADFTDYEGGFAAQRFSNVSIVRDGTESVTIGVYEMSGSPVREFLTTWMTGVRDPKSGVAHYHGFMDETCPYGEINHTAELIYFVTDPTLKKIEYACLLAHCFPTKVDKDHLNYESGSHDAAEMEIEFRCTKYESRYINDIAAFYLAADTIKYNYLDFDPHITEEKVLGSNPTFPTGE